MAGDCGMREHSIVLFLRLVTLIDGRNPQQLRRLLNMKRSTFNRYVEILRRCGVVVTYSHKQQRYTVIDAGPFNLMRLRQATFDEARKAIVSLPRAA